MTRLLLLLGCSLVIMSHPTRSSAQSDSLSINMIQRAIMEKGYSWTSGENSVTRLPDNDKKEMLGGLAPEPGTPSRPREDSDALILNTLTFFSWGDSGSHNWMTPIKNQGGCGSCWANCVVPRQIRHRCQVGSLGQQLAACRQE